MSTLLLAAHHACHDLVRILSLAGLVRENSSLAVSADLPVKESESWPLAAFIMAASSSTQNRIMADDESTQTVGPKGGKRCERSNTETGSKRSQKRTAPKSDDNSTDIASQSFASQISELTKSIKDSHLALINRSLEKQEKHKPVVLSETMKEKHKPRVTLHNLARRSKSLLVTMI